MVTNYIKNASYKEIYDIHTDSESTSILTVHTPITNFPRQMLGGFFKQYRKFRYKGCRLTMRPASTLPADPAQISLEAGEPPIDARDMLNPILMRGYSGESLGYFLNLWNTPGYQNSVYRDAPGDPLETREGSGFYGSSLDKTSFPEGTTAGYISGDDRATYLEKLYYQSLSDQKFRKIPMQKGTSKSFYPLVYELVTTTQRLATSPENTAFNTISNRAPSGTQSSLIATLRNNTYDMSDIATADSDKKASLKDEAAATLYTGNNAGQTSVRYRRVVTPLLTSHKRRLGWLDTDTRVVVPGTSVVPNNSNILSTNDYVSTGSATENSHPDSVVANTTLPLINMGVVIMPKAYKTEMYYRVTLQHFFDFKEYRPLCGLVSPFDTHSIEGPSLEWSDWDDNQYTFPSPSLTSTSKNVDLIDVSTDGNM